MKKQPICKILTVDDEMGIDSFFYEFFTLRNFKVFNATSGKEAIKVVEKEKPRIVLLDINMKGMDGIETLKKIKEMNKDVTVIMVTGVKDDDVVKVVSKALKLEKSHTADKEVGESDDAIAS